MLQIVPLWVMCPRPGRISPVEKSLVREFYYLKLGYSSNVGVEVNTIVDGFWIKLVKRSPKYLFEFIKYQILEWTNYAYN